MTTQDIINFLPLDENVKKDLLENFDRLDQDQKFNIEQMVWGAYDCLYKLKVEERVKKALLEEASNPQKLDENFYAKIRKEVEEEMSGGMFTTQTETGLSKVQNELKELISKSSNNPTTNNMN